MRTSQLLLATLREEPAEAETASHRLMLRAGMVRRLAAGIYTWLPLGWRVLRKVERIVREEMDRIGGQELLMPSVQPGELWRESGRWEEFGPELLRFSDRHEREFCLGPTHEEVITDLVRREIRSYKRLPVTFYQIQTKFRDEIRPRFGIMRAREFLMKDAYSFHLDKESLEETYRAMYEAYERILSRIGLDFRVVEADTGSIGGQLSHEFHVLAQSGEDRIAFNDHGDYAVNAELVACRSPTGERAPPKQTMRAVSTPGRHTIADVATFLEVPAAACLKSLLVEGRDGGLVMLVLRGDHELNRLKAERLDEVATPLHFAGEAEILEQAGCLPGSLGPVGLDLPMIADCEAACLADFVCGANRNGEHLVGVNWDRDVPLPRTADLRFVTAGEPAPNGGPLRIERGIEVGHIFQLGTKYSTAMNAVCLDRHGQAQPLIMGCYGIGVSRLVAAAIEQGHDERGILWPASISPYPLVLIPIQMHKSQRLREAVEALYRELQEAGLDVLLDDRRERPGVMYNDAELVGIPHWLIFSESGLDRGRLEYRRRGRDGDKRGEIALRDAVTSLQRTLGPQALAARQAPATT